MTASALTVTAAQRAALERMAASTTLPHRQVVQAKALLLAAEGLANEHIAWRCELGSDTVRRWRARFAEQGVEGVGKIAKGRGRKSPLTEGTSAQSRAGEGPGGPPVGAPGDRLSGGSPAPDH